MMRDLLERRPPACRGRSGWAAWLLLLSASCGCGGSGSPSGAGGSGTGGGAAVGTGGAAGLGGTRGGGGQSGAGGTTGAGGRAVDGGVDTPPRDAGPDRAPVEVGSEVGSDVGLDVGSDVGSDAAGDGGSALLAGTPPMGWNSWNTFQCNMDETLIKATADAMVSSGMQAAGYQYVNLDDCWMNGRDAAGNLRWNTTKFPAGIPALAAYIHGKGLKLGIYQSANTATCVGIYGGIDRAVAVGSLGHEAQDAATFASWNVDFLKYDLCAGDRASFAKMRDGLRATRRPMVYSINPGNGANDLYPPTTAGWDVINIANMWRIGFDINASWASVLSLIDQDAAFASFAGPGHWNDPDMLEVGKGLTADEDRAHFSLWAMLAAPLIAGNDIRSMSAATRTILINPEVIAIDQDPLGSQGQRLSAAANLEIWSRRLAGTNTRAVALFNRSAAAAAITVTWTAIGLPAGAATVRDLWAHADRGSFIGSYTGTGIPSHGVAMLRISSGP
jgi:alpha-galactosidase